MRDQLQRIMVEQREWSFAELSGEDWVVLNDYLSANQLLLECLGQAVVSDRRGIEDRLLLVPKGGDGHGHGYGYEG